MKKMDQRLERLRRIEKVVKNFKKKMGSLDREREEILKGISDGSNPVRITEINKEVVEIRQKIVRTPEIKMVLEKYNIPIDDVALISCWRERLEGWDKDYHYPGYTNTSAEITDPDFNMWIISERYLYGGPGDKVKVFFDRSKNSQYHICGFITNFPLKMKKAA